MLGQFTYKASSLVHSKKKNDLLLLLVEGGGELIELDGVAKQVWEILQKPHTLKQLEKKLLAEYEVEPKQLHQDLLDLLDKMVTDQLVKKVG